MATETIIPTGWVAFVKDKECLGYQEFKAGGKYAGTLTLIDKPTEAQLKTELKRLKISLPV
jgi:hypothetical protein